MQLSHVIIKFFHRLAEVTGQKGESGSNISMEGFVTLSDGNVERLSSQFPRRERNISPYWKLLRLLVSLKGEKRVDMEYLGVLVEVRGVVSGVVAAVRGVVEVRDGVSGVLVVVRGLAFWLCILALRSARFPLAAYIMSCTL